MGFIIDRIDTPDGDIMPVVEVTRPSGVTREIAFTGDMILTYPSSTKETWSFDGTIPSGMQSIFISHRFTAGSDGSYKVEVVDNIPFIDFGSDEMSFNVSSDGDVGNGGNGGNGGTGGVDKNTLKNAAIIGGIAIGGAFAVEKLRGK